MLNDYTLELLDLKGVEITNLEHDKDHIDVFTRSLQQEGQCPSCHTLSHRIHDYRLQRIQHVNIGSKKVYLHHRKKRFLCPCCHKRFYEKLPFLGKYQRRTIQTNMFILSELQKVQPFKAIADELRLSPATIVRYLKYVPMQKTSLPECLSIDEFKGNAGGEKYQCLLVNAERKEVFDVLSSRKMNDLLKYFTAYPRHVRNKVRYVVIDMYRVYKDVIQMVFPNATILVDKFHFARQCMWALENVRKNQQKNMSVVDRKYFKRSKSLLRKRKSRLKEEEMIALCIMLERNEPIRIAYKLKEDFHDFLDAQDYFTAQNALAKWVKEAQESGLKEFRACLTAFNNWRQEILNAYYYGFSNGPTEGINNKIKVIKRVSYGYRNFENFMRRILWICRA